MTDHEIDEFDEERQRLLLEEIDDVQCRGIRASVLIQACIDARTRGTKRENIKRRAEAMAWLAGDNEDSEFALVCELAGVDPKRFRRNMRKFLDPRSGLDFRCGRKSRPWTQVRKDRATKRKGELYDKQQSTDQNRPSGEYSCSDMGKRGR